MEESFEEMMKSYINNYLDFDIGKKTMFLSMARVLNNNNISKINYLLNSTAYFMWSLKDLEHISVSLQNLLNVNCNELSENSCKIICDTIIKVCELCDLIEIHMISDFELKSEVNRIYTSISRLNVMRRVLTLEEWIEMSDLDEEKQDCLIQNKYTPPERAEESRLKKYGYSVAWNSDMTTKQRQALLKELIETGKESKGYIISYLKHNIQINGKKKTNEFALKKWQEDLDFVYSL
ncbi:MAG: hypothetical protein IJZ57_07215 [Clostridia bacterium]|nr:hypothetical protein [Clostridia bacterium]